MKSTLTIAIVVVFILFLTYKLGWKRMLGIIPNLKFSELDELLQDPYSVESERLERLSADFSAKLYNRNGSVIYDRSRRRGKVIESLDVYVPGRAGMILTFREGSIVQFKRAAGIGREPEDLTSSEKRCAKSLLTRVRDLVKEQEEKCD